MSNFLLSAAAMGALRLAAGEKAMPPNIPFLKLDFYHIKTPQLIGIIAGCAVFTVTIATVVYLLYASGSLGKAMAELVEESSRAGDKQSPRGPSAAKGKPARVCIPTSPQFLAEPELYEHLLQARKTLPLAPHMPPKEGKQVCVRMLRDSDEPDLFKACNGSALFHESDYDPQRIWGWIERSACSDPWTSLDAFRAFLRTFPANSAHITIVDKELRRPIGLVTLADNSPGNLTVRIASMWVTPAFQGTRRSHEALFHVLKWLVDSGYRRVSVELDERHQIGRRFLLRCGLLLEAVLRKHRVVQNRNSNTALFVMLNSDWQSIESNLRVTLDLPAMADKVLKAAALPTAIDRSELPSYPSMEPAQTSSGGGGTRRKLKKKKTQGAAKN